MCRTTKIIALSLFVLLAFSFDSGFAQAPAKQKKPKTLRESARKSMRKRDSLFQALNKSDTSAATMFEHLQQYTTTFNQINNNLADGLDTADQSEQLPIVLRRLNRIKALTIAKKSSTLRYLFVLRDNLDRLQDMMEGWQDDLDDVNAKLVQNQHDILRFRSDTVLANAMPSDTALREAFFDKRAELGELWKKTDSANRTDLFKVNLLQNKISSAYAGVLDGTDQIDNKIRKFAVRAMSGEFDYIWVPDKVYNHTDSAIRGTIRLNQIQANYFFKKGTVVHMIAIGFLLLVVAWILYSKYRMVRHFEHKEVVIDHARFIYKKPIVSALLLATTIAPYFYDHPPVFFLECVFLIMTILVLIMVRDHFPLSLFHFLHQLFWLTVVYSLSNLLIEITNLDRYLILILSIASILFALIFYKRTKKEPQGHLKYTQLTLKVFIALQFISLLLNITGRFSLAKIIGITAVFNLWLTMSLYFIIRIIIQALYLHLHTQKAEKSFISLVDYNTIQKKFRALLSVFATLLWLFFLLQNLNIDDTVHDYLSDLLSQQRNIGGATFTFGGFVIFFVVIWISSLLSKLISYFYDISSQHAGDISVLKKKNRASTLLIRIGVFTIGFLLAVAASGFPLDKLTIIFSAFGVGIGFGLQNVTNNLVSGMILAFEKPIQIGDIIEVNNRTGTVKEIGIRSSKLATGDGSEVIIPNGDLISQNVVNWTLSNTNRRVEILISVASGTEISKVTETLKSMLTTRDDIMLSPEPQVFLSGITDKSIDFRVLFWAADISHYMELRSRVLSDISDVFKKQGIQMPKS